METIGKASAVNLIPKSNKWITFGFQHISYQNLNARIPNPKRKEKQTNILENGIVDFATSLFISPILITVNLNYIRIDLQ